MTRTTTSLHEVTGYELSPSAALRTLRSIAFRDWETYRPRAEVSASGVVASETFGFGPFAFGPTELETFEADYVGAGHVDDYIEGDYTETDSVEAEALEAESQETDLETEGDDLEMEGEDLKPETLAPVLWLDRPQMDDAAGAGATWYLNEVPAEWLADIFDNH